MCQSPTLRLYYKRPLIEAFACPENPAAVIAEQRKENAELKAEIADIKKELGLQASRIVQLEALVEQLVRKEQT
jgi:uncharacterized protein involved in exopolysaccharide biosynthesis